MIVDGRYVHRIDATVAKNFRLLQVDLEARDQKVIFWNWCESARNTLTSYDKSLAVHFKESENVSQVLKGKYSISFIIHLTNFLSD